MKLLFLSTILLASILEFFGDASFKTFARTNNYSILSGGLFIYAMMIAVIISILRYSNVIYMNTQWDAVSIIVEATLGYILLGERITNVYQLSGIGLIIIGVILMNIGTIPL